MVSVGESWQMSLVVITSRKIILVAPGESSDAESILSGLHLHPRGGYNSRHVEAGRRRSVIIVKSFTKEKNPPGST